MPEKYPITPQITHQLTHPLTPQHTHPITHHYLSKSAINFPDQYPPPSEIARNGPYWLAVIALAATLWASLIALAWRFL